MLATDPEVLLLDEPSSGMGPEEAHQLGDTLLDLRRDFGLSIMMIEHHVPLVVRVCDYVYCLDFGQLLTHGTPDEVRRHPQVVAAYLGEDPEPDVVALEERARRARGDRLMALLEVEELRVGYGFPVLLGIDFEVAEGETAVLFGLNGAGKTTTLSTVAGLLKPDGGAIRFDGTRIDGQVPDVAGAPRHRPRARGAARVPGAQRGQQPAPRRLDAPAQQGELDQQRELVFEYFPRLAERADQDAGTLSGGEQQMLAIGRALMSKPRLLLIDEASLGSEPGAGEDRVPGRRPDQRRRDHGDHRRAERRRAARTPIGP